MAGPDFIHVRDSDDIVVGVFLNSSTPGAGVTEFNETHPVFMPHWSLTQWHRDAANTYTDTGTSVVTLPNSDATVAVSADDASAEFLDTKLTAGNAVTLTVNTDSLGVETLDIAVDNTQLDDDYVNETGDTMTGNLVMSGSTIGVRTDASTATDPTYTFTGHTDTGMYIESTGDLAFTVNGICTLEIADSNNVVFISSDVANYETLVTQDDHIPNKKYVDDAIAGGTGEFTDGGEVGGANRTLGNTDAFDLGFETTNATRLTIKSGGDVGINNTNPGAKLQIDGSSTSNEVLIVKGVASQSAPFMLVQDSSNNKVLEIESNGTLNVSGTTNYESLVTNDDDIPNKKYVDDNVGAGDVTAASNLEDNSIIRGDGAVKGVQKSLWHITDAGKMTSSLNIADYVLDVHNTRTPSGGNGFRIKAGEALGDIAFHVADQDDTFQIMEMEADQGYVTLGKTYAQTLSDNGTVYGVDIQHSGQAKDFNTQSGVYRIAGNPVMHGTFYQSTASEGISSTTSGSPQEKLTLTTPSLPSGTYRIGWTGTLKSTGDARMQVELDNTTTLDLHHIDSSTNDYVSFGGFYVTGSISGVHDIDVDYWAVSGTSSLQMVRLEIWRLT